jgi:hypothetical protein
MYTNRKCSRACISDDSVMRDATMETRDLYISVLHAGVSRMRSILFKFTAACDPTFERSFCMIHMVGNIWKSSFSCNKWDIFWSSELGVMTNKWDIFWSSKLGVMTNLVQAAQAAWWQRENCRRLHKCSTKRTFHMLLLVLILHLSRRDVPSIYTDVLHLRED